MNLIEFNILAKIFKDWRVARGMRHLIFGTGVALSLSGYFVYYAMTRGNDWTKVSGWKTFYGKPMIFPGDKEWPHATSQHYQNKSDFAAFDFKANEESNKKITISTPLRYS